SSIARPCGSPRRRASWNTSAWRTTSTWIASFSRRLENRRDEEGGQQGCCQEIESEDLHQPLGRRAIYERLYQGQGGGRVQQDTGFTSFNHPTGNDRRPKQYHQRVF